MNKNTLGVRILGTATKSDIPRYAWKTVTDPEEIKAIDKWKAIEFNKRFAYQSVLQILTFAMGFGSCYWLIMPQEIKDSYVRGYARAYQTCLTNK